MNFDFSPTVQDFRQRLLAFMDAHIYPNEALFRQQISEGDRWAPTRIVEELKPKARAEGLWNLFLPDSQYGAGLSNLEYAPLCEIMGRSPMAPEVFNCSAPDTGNMEVLVRYGTQEQKERWLKPLLAGEIRSCFSMTEPASRRCASDWPRGTSGIRASASPWRSTTAGGSSSSARSDSRAPIR